MKQLILFSCALGAFSASAAVPKAMDPRTMGETPQYARYYMQRQNWFMAHKDAIGPGAVIILGDSISEIFQNSKAYKAHFSQEPGKEFKALDLGNDGERTENVLWHIESGQLDGYKAKAIVVAIGTNNVGNNYPTEDVVKAMELIIDRLRFHQPDVPIIVQAIFPRGREANHPDRAKVQAVNAGYKRVAAEKKVEFLAIWDEFLDPDGTLPKEMMSDGLHPAEKGCEVWANALLPVLRRLP